MCEFMLMGPMMLLAIFLAGAWFGWPGAIVTTLACAGLIAAAIYQLFEK